MKNQARMVRELIQQNQLLIALADIRAKRIEHLEERLKQQTYTDSFGCAAQDPLQWSYGMNLSSAVDTKTPSKATEIRLSSHKMS